MNKGTLRFKPNASPAGTGRWYLDFRDGSPLIRCKEYRREDERAKVEAWRDKYIAAMQRLGAGEAVRTLTVEEWFGKYHDAAEKGTVGRKNRGRPQESIEDRRTRFRVHLKRLIGHLPMVDGKVTAEDMRRVVRYLDAQQRVRREFYRDERERDAETGKKPGLSPKSALHMWSECTSGFREAVNSKTDELRVLTVDPTRGVLGPDGGEEREQSALYPSEVLTLLSCAKIPARRRITYAGAIYTGARRSELERITASDVDLEHGLIIIRGKKTAAAQRRVPIEATLRPLIARLVNAYPQGPLFDVPRAGGNGGWAEVTKDDLARAELTRDALWEDDDRHMPFNGHGLRHTAITHWYVAGRDETFLKRSAGHTSNAMTRRYLDGAAVGRATFGTPHPPIPQELVDAVPDHPDRDGDAHVSVVPSEATIPKRFRKVRGAGHGIRKSSEVPEKQTDSRSAVPCSEPLADTRERSDHARPGDLLERALADALSRAAAAGRFDVVAQLATELAARRGAVE